MEEDPMELVTLLSPRRAVIFLEINQQMALPEIVLQLASGV